VVLGFHRISSDGFIIFFDSSWEISSFENISCLIVMCNSQFRIDVLFFLLFLENLFDCLEFFLDFILSVFKKRFFVPFDASYIIFLFL